MKRAMMMLLALLFSAGLGMAQELNTSSMARSGQSGPSEEARYVLGLVRNGKAASLNKYFDTYPWKIQTEIDVYKDASQNASVSVFCVAVDMGNLDVVKAFVEHDYGPADLCRVQTFSTKKIIVSKADRYVNDYTSSSSSGSSSSGGRSFSSRTWFGYAEAKQEGSSSSYSEESSSSHSEEYHQISYGEKKVVKTYFANPLDFATGEVFDYLWEQGFRSNNLFTAAALADARNTGRTEVYNYILDNKFQGLKEEMSYISEETYNQLTEAARENPDSFATELLVRDVLGKVKTSAQAKVARREADRLMQEQLTRQVADTVGYNAVVRDLAAREKSLRQREAAVEAKKAEYREKAQCYCYGHCDEIWLNPNNPRYALARFHNHGYQGKPHGYYKVDLDTKEKTLLGLDESKINWKEYKGYEKVK